MKTLLNLTEDQQLIDSINRSNAMAEFSPDGIILSCNQNFLKLFDYKTEQLVGKHHSILVDAQERDSSSYKNFWQRLSEGHFFSGEFLRKNCHGKEVWIRGTYNPILNDQGKPYKILKFALDVTLERDIFNKYSEQLKAINLSNAILELDLNENILHANDNFLKIFDYQLSEIQGKHHSVLLFDEDKTSDKYKEFWKKLKKGEFASDEFRRRSRTGKIIWIRGSYNPILDHNQKTYKIIKFALDVTKEKELQKEIENDRILVANSSRLASLGEMAAGIAHEINNPTTIISCCVDDLILDLQQGSLKTEEVIINLEKIKNTAERIAKIIKGLKNFSRSGEKDEKKLTPLKIIIENVLSISQERLRNSKIDFQCFPIDENLVAHCREVEISQVLLNFLNNSLDAIADSADKKILLKTGSLDEHYVFFEVWDTGPGVPEHLKEKIFEPFFTSKQPGKGTGLGLSISVRIIHDHQGKIVLYRQDQFNIFRAIIKK